MVMQQTECSPGDEAAVYTTADTSLLRHAALSKLLDRRQGVQRADLERNQSFSWMHCIISAFSYMLMLSDVPRTGFGIQDLSPYSVIEPDHLVVFGPYAYPGTPELLKNATTGSTAMPFWIYKYDSTSLSMRAIAKHLAIPTWSACVLYDEMCDERVGLQTIDVFNMIDSLIEGIKIRQDTHQLHGRDDPLTLRTQYRWCDRLHDYAFPWFFSSPRLRTIQAIHFDAQQLAANRMRTICASPKHRMRPLTCDDAITNFDRLCRPSNSLCQGIHKVHAHLPARLYKILEQYPNHTLDFALLEGVDDFSRSGLAFQGSKFVDIVALARIQQCTGDSTNGSTVCETVLVDDFRYETVSHVANTTDWFWVTVTIRGIGQLYAWLRLTFLLVGCYAARSNEPRMQQRSYLGRLMLTVRTVFLLPSQVMVYGSLFPISCYLLAHLIDAAAVYELMGEQLTTLMGVISLEFGEIMRVCAVSMRSLWLLAFICHVAHWIATHCAWSPIHGVPGIPEFSLSLIASLTILAQVRHPSLRNSQVLFAEELVPSPARYHWNSVHSDSTHSFLHKLVFGTLIDFKCLAVSVCLHIAIVLAVRLVNQVLPRFVTYQLMLFTRTVVPYGAGSLWPSCALVVSWNGTFLAARPLASRYKTTPMPIPIPTPTPARVATSTFAASFRGVLQSFDRRSTVGIQPLSVSVAPKMPLTLTSATTNIHRNELRSHEIDALIYLMNLGVMSDPLVYLRLCVLPGKLIGVFESRLTQRCILLPLALTTSLADIPIEWSELELRFVVHTSELAWCDLLRCG